MLVVRKDLPAQDLKSFIAYAKTHPLTYGSAGVGSSTHLGCALLADAAGFKATHVPYRGMGPVMQDLTAGRIDFGCDFVLGALPQVQGQTLKAMAVLTKARSAAMPDVPTADEQGLKGFEAYNWNAMFLPKGTPEPVVKKLHAALMQALDTPSVRDRLLQAWRGDSASRAADAGISRHLRQRRNCQVGWPNQSKRCHGRIIASSAGP